MNRLNLYALVFVAMTSCLSCLSTVGKPYTPPGVGEEPTWLPYDTIPWDIERLPLSVLWDRAAWSEDANLAMLSAMAKFPCGLFVPWEPSQGRPDVYVFLEGDGLRCGLDPTPLDLGNGRRAAGIATVCWGAGEIWLEPKYSQLGGNDTELIMFHELGHIAGLAHDPKVEAAWLGEVSVMVPDILKHRHRDLAGLELPVLTEKDTEALTGAYCNE